MMASSIADSDDLEPLHNCISLLHMLRGRVAGSRKLFWRNVRMECERFLEEVCDGSADTPAQGLMGHPSLPDSSMPRGTDGDCWLLSKRCVST
jgi:hypothetical protein